MQEKEEKNLLIYSGGLDSTTLLYMKRENIKLALTFDYNQRHNREIIYAKNQCALLHIPHQIIPMDAVGRSLKSNLLETNKKPPPGPYSQETINQTIVPFRNGIMLSIAAGIAASRGYTHLLIAVHANDAVTYPDCTLTFITHMNAAIQRGTNNQVQISAPFISLTKAKIIKRSHALNINYKNTYSCYAGEKLHCGVCSTCLERKNSFRLADVTDPTEYAQ